MLEGSAETPGKRVLNLRGGGGWKRPLRVGTRKASVTDGKGVGGTLTWGWSLDFRDVLKVSRDVRGSAPTVGNRCGWVETPCFRGSCLKFGTSRRLPERLRPLSRRRAPLGFQLGRRPRRARACKHVPLPPSVSFRGLHAPSFPGL